MPEIFSIEKTVQGQLPNAKNRTGRKHYDVGESLGEAKQNRETDLG